MRRSFTLISTFLGFCPQGIAAGKGVLVGSALGSEGELAMRTLVWDNITSLFNSVLVEFSGPGAEREDEEMRQYLFNIFEPLESYQL